MAASVASNEFMKRNSCSDKIYAATSVSKCLACQCTKYIIRKLTKIDTLPIRTLL
jgi:hypothetical protein